MSMQDWIKAQAEEHRKLGEAKAAEVAKGQEEALARKETIKQGSQGLWDQLVSQFMEAGEALKLEYPDQRISVNTGPNELMLDKGKFPSMRVIYRRVNELAVVQDTSLTVVSGAEPVLSSIEYKMDLSSQGIAFHCADELSFASQVPSSWATPTALVQQSMKFVMKHCQ